MFFSFKMRFSCNFYTINNNFLCGESRIPFYSILFHVLLFIINFKNKILLFSLQFFESLFL